MDLLQDGSSLAFCFVYNSPFPQSKYLRELNIVHRFWQVSSLNIRIVEAAKGLNKDFMLQCSPVSYDHSYKKNFTLG